MRVLVSAETFLPAVNGVTNSVLRAIDHLDTNGHEVRVIAPAHGPADDHHVLASGTTIRVERVPGLSVPMYHSLTSSVPSTRRVRDVIEDFDPDVVHLAAPVMLGRRVGAIARRADIPTVALFQTDLAGFVTNYGLRAAAGPVWRWLRTIHNDADLTLAPTPTLAGELRRRGFERVAIWGRGVDHHQFDPARRSADVRAACGVSPGQVAVGYVGRLAAEKRVDLLSVLATDPRIKLVVVGDGPDRGRLERLLPDAHFVGFRRGDELGEAMASLDVFVHTGEHETFCQTIQEAMSCRVPVVAPAAGGPLDLVDDGINGFLYRAGGREHLAQTIEPLIGSAALRRRIGLGGGEFVADKTWRAIGDQLLGHYRSVIGDDRATRSRATLEPGAVDDNPGIAA